MPSQGSEGDASLLTNNRANTTLATSTGNYSQVGPESPGGGTKLNKSRLLQFLKALSIKGSQHCSRKTEILKVSLMETNLGLSAQN